MDIHSNRADARPLWRRFALDEPQEIDAEVGPDTVDALGELETEQPAHGSGAAAGRESAWARLAFALDLRRHARALAGSRRIDR
ncbi:MAG: hypothetical protein V4669_11620 [Pseudomonadota bacterium]